MHTNRKSSTIGTSFSISSDITVFLHSTAKKFHKMYFYFLNYSLARDKQHHPDNFIEIIMQYAHSNMNMGLYSKLAKGNFYKIF